MLWQTSLVPDEWSDRRDALPQGSVLRDYTIEEVLGHGGFGIVYKARHNELDHVVAIKEYLPSELAVREGTTIRARSADCETFFADGLRRFREEAKALIDFQQHPSIVDCRDFFRANGTAYLVMEYVEGLPLSELLRQREAAGRPFTEPDLLGIAIPLAVGLAHIHRAGVIHRDIKPANILVRSTDQQPVLIDFGAAKQAVAEHSRSLAPYTEGYAALEQVADGQLGPWTDLYGFGAVLWRMVAGGNRPWDPPNPVKVESRANAGLRDADDPLPTAEELGVGRFADRLLELIDGCLQLKDTDRIRESERVVQVLQGSGEEGSLQSATAGQPAEGGHGVDRPDPVSEDPRTGRSSGRRLWKVVGVAAVIAMAVALSTVALIPRNEISETPDRWSFSIEAEPSTATVALLNGPEAYRPGMLLAPGQYEVEVSAPGFVAQRERVTHLESETLHHVELDPLPRPEPEPVPPTSSDGTPKPAGSTVAGAEDFPNDLPKLTEPIGADPMVANDQEYIGVYRASLRASPAIEEFARRRQEYTENYLAYLTSSNAVDPVVANAQESIGGESQDTCGGRDLQDCSRLGLRYERGIGVQTDLARAAEIYELTCDGGDAYDCRRLGSMYENGEGVPTNNGHAARFYQRACDGGDAYGCRSLGLLYRDGDGVAFNHGRAEELFERACDGGNAIGCWNLGMMYEEGNGVSLDRARAAKLFERSCDGHNDAGCWILGDRYEKGEGVPMDHGHAAKFYQRACDGGWYAPGCWSLGLLYKDGEGVALSHGRAAELFERACAQRAAPGCYSLALMYHDGDGVLLNRTHAAELYQQACEGGVAAACNNLGLLHDNGYGVGQDQVRAAELYHGACEGGSTSGCFNLGLSYHDGKGVRRDRTRAAELYQQACEGENMSGCYMLGVNYYLGQGIGRNRATAASLFEKACASGHKDACKALGR